MKHLDKFKTFERRYFGYDGNIPLTPRRKRKLYAPPDVHIPDKQEAKLLRKLMADTGLSEKEIRAIKKYRKMLWDSEERNIIPKRKKIAPPMDVKLFRKIENKYKDILDDIFLPLKDEGIHYSTSTGYKSGYYYLNICITRANKINLGTITSDIDHFIDFMKTEGNQRVRSVFSHEYKWKPYVIHSDYSYIDTYVDVIKLNFRINDEILKKL